MLSEFKTGRSFVFDAVDERSRSNERTSNHGDGSQAHDLNVDAWFIASSSSLRPFSFDFPSFLTAADPSSGIVKKGVMIYQLIN